jgi:hypothetical protein
MTAEDLQRNDTVFQIGVAPRRIDIITGATGLDYATAARNAVPCRVDGLDIKVLSLDDLILNKQSTGRPKDQVDADELGKIRQRNP